MNQKEFLNNIGNCKKDIIQDVIDILNRNSISYCVIGGLAVNAYVEPVVSLDLDIVVLMDSVDMFLDVSKGIFKIEKFPHSINLGSKDSDIRIQIQIDERYQDFITRASVRNILGYQMFVASLEDILRGKIWAYSDKQRRASKRQKDLADIMRIIESFPKLKIKLPESIIEILNNTVYLDGK